MANGNRVETDEREKLFLGQVPLDDLPTERIRPIEDDDGDPARGTGLHHERRRPDEGVIAAAHVGKVRDDGIEIGEVLGPRGELLESGAVKGNDRKARRLSRRDGLHVLRRPPEPMLGPEQDSHVEARIKERARGGTKAGGHRGRIREKADPFPFENLSRRLAVLEKDVESGGGRGSLHPTECSGTRSAPR